MDSVAMTEQQIDRFRSLMERKTGMQLALKAAMRVAADDLAETNRRERELWDELLTPEMRKQGEWVAVPEAGIVRRRGGTECNFTE